MVRYFVLFFFLIGSMFSGFGQNKCPDTIFFLFHHPPEPPSDMKKVVQFIAENIKYPESAKKDSISGTVVVRFWIDTAGFTSEHTVVKGVREDLNEETLRVARLIKFDKPATTNDKPVGMCCWLPIKFPPEEDKPKPQRFGRFFKKR